MKHLVPKTSGALRWLFAGVITLVLIPVSRIDAEFRLHTMLWSPGTHHYYFLLTSMLTGIVCVICLLMSIHREKCILSFLLFFIALIAVYECYDPLVRGVIGCTMTSDTLFSHETLRDWCSMFLGGPWY